MSENRIAASKSNRRIGCSVTSVANSAVASGDVLYAGAAQDQPGVCQIDVRLPASLADGDIPVVPASRAKAQINEVAK